MRMRRGRLVLGLCLSKYLTAEGHADSAYAEKCWRILLTAYRVFLNATNEKALSKVSLEEFKKFAAKE